VHTKNLGGPLDNKLLSSLPRDQFDLLAPHLITQSLTQGLVLIETGNEVDYVYFPHFGILSLLVVLKDGKAIEDGNGRMRRRCRCDGGIRTIQIASPCRCTASGWGY
jgi:hypothetical protein